MLRRREYGKDGNKGTHGISERAICSLPCVPLFPSFPYSLFSLFCDAPVWCRGRAWRRFVTSNIRFVIVSHSRATHIRRVLFSRQTAPPRVAHWRCNSRRQ